MTQLRAQIGGEMAEVPTVAGSRWAKKRKQNIVDLCDTMESGCTAPPVTEKQRPGVQLLSYLI